MCKRTTINGVRVPYELETTELLHMLDSKDMSSFSIACEALSYKTEDCAFHELVPFLSSRDKYQRLCVFKVIYRHPKAVALKQYLIEQLGSSDLLFVSAALRNIVNYRMNCPQEEIKKAVLQNRNSLYDEFEALRMLDTNEGNYRFLKSLLLVVNQSIAQEIITEILIEQYGSTKGDDLVCLLSVSQNPKLRRCAVVLGKELGIDIPSRSSKEKRTSMANKNQQNQLTLIDYFIILFLDTTRATERHQHLRRSTA